MSGVDYDRLNKLLEKVEERLKALSKAPEDVIVYPTDSDAFVVGWIRLRKGWVLAVGLEGEESLRSYREATAYERLELSRPPFLKQLIEALEESNQRFATRLNEAADELEKWLEEGGESCPQ